MECLKYVRHIIFCLWVWIQSNKYLQHLLETGHVLANKLLPNANNSRRSQWEFMLTILQFSYTDNSNSNLNSKSKCLYLFPFAVGGSGLRYSGDSTFSGFYLQKKKRTKCIPCEEEVGFLSVQTNWFINNMRRKETTDFVYTNRMHKAETNREIEEKTTKFCFSSIVEI